jgi:hypothetical protein
MSTLYALLLQTAGGIHFDATISLGNVLTATGFALAAIKFWSAQISSQRDMNWRVSNLEKWRSEHMIDADSRDHLIASIADIAKKLQWVEEARRKQEHAPPGKRRINDL